jgi:2-dehydro-3-deoxygalactonokinase
MTVLIDWGTSNIRAYRLVDGAVADRRARPQRLAALRDAAAFRACFDGLTDGWLPDAVLLAGMVGSRQGWVEAPYADCPARLADLAGALTPVPGLADAAIVPGLACQAESGAPDVLRGEEVQVFGTVAGGADALLCLPGTHSKWVTVRAGAVTGFATAMTGELFATLRQHSLLAATTAEAEVAPDDPAFLAGVAWAARPGGLTHHLFAARTRPLREAMAPADATAFLSGLLIGHEIAGLAGTAGAVTLVGAPALCARYAAALTARGIASTTVDAETATIAGLTRLAALL